MPYAELLDGANLSGVELGDEISFENANIKREKVIQNDLSDYQFVDRLGTPYDFEFYAERDTVNVALRDSGLSNADLSKADLPGANLREADLTDANLKRADLSGARPNKANLSGTNLSSANLFKVDVADCQIDDADDVIVNSGTRISSRIPLRTGFRHGFLIVGSGRKWDQRARGYEALRKVFENKGLDHHHRKLYSFQRRARAKEALRRARVVQWLGNYFSRILTGHGVMISRVLFWTALLIFAPWYWYGLVESWANGSLDSGPLYYSVVTFVTAPPAPLPEVSGSTNLLLTTVNRQSLNQAIVLFQTYAGTALIVLLGYVLGNRDPI